MIESIICKKNISFLIFLGIIVVVVSCDDNVGILEQENEILMARNNLFQADAENNLVVSVSDLSANSYQFTFEDESTLKLKKNVVDSITVDDTEWKVTIYYIDGDVQTVSYLGSELEILSENVVLDPFNLAPLSGLITFDTKVEGTVKIRIEGRDGPSSDIVHQFQDLSKHHEIPVLGLYPDFENKVEISFTNQEGLVRKTEIFTFQTDPLTDKFSTVEIKVVVNELPEDDNDFVFLSNLGTAFDKFGRVRWYLTGTGNIYTRLSNGNIIRQGENGFLYHFISFNEITMVGKVIRSYAIDNDAHHEVRELPNGNLLVGTNSVKPEVGDELPEEDFIIEIDRETGETLESWDLNEILDPTRQWSVNPNRPNDWAHNNSIWYDDDTDALIASIRSQNAVVKFDRSTKQIVWILGSHDFWKAEFQPFLLEPLNLIDDTDWNWAQHSAMQQPNGNIFLFDNGNRRSYDEEAPLETYSRAVEFSVDEENMTVEKVWEYGKDLNLFASTFGDVDILESGNRLIDFPNTEPPFTKVVELTDDAAPQVLFEVDVIESRNYRIQKMNIYQ